MYLATSIPTYSTGYIIISTPVYTGSGGPSKLPQDPEGNSGQVTAKFARLTPADIIWFLSSPRLTPAGSSLNRHSLYKLVLHPVQPSAQHYEFSQM